MAVTDKKFHEISLIKIHFPRPDKYKIPDTAVALQPPFSPFSYGKKYIDRDHIYWQRSQWSKMCLPIFICINPETHDFSSKCNIGWSEIFTCLTKPAFAPEFSPFCGQVLRPSGQIHCSDNSFLKWDGCHQ